MPACDCWKTILSYLSKIEKIENPDYPWVRSSDKKRLETEVRKTKRILPKLIKEARKYHGSKNYDFDILNNLEKCLDEK